jgi:AraC family transcriptional regulator, positive regulator of tynA and feaB
MGNRVEQWDIADMPPADRFDWWREVLAETHVPWDLGSSRDASPAYQARVERRQVGRVRIVDCSCDPCAGTRGAPEIAATTDEWAIVLFNLHGREIFEQNDGCSELGPGSAVLWQSTWPARFTVLEPLRKRCLFVPREELENRCPGFHRLTGMPLTARTPETRLFMSFLAETIRAFPALSPDGKRTAARVTVELLAAALRPQCTLSPGSLHDALFVKICGYIDRHVRDASLRPQSIADAHHISLRTLQLIFAEHGETVSHRIRRLRLDRCQADIVQSGRPIASVALRWGFVDPAHFSRVFRDRYGMSPREARAAITSAIAAESPALAAEGSLLKPVDLGPPAVATDQSPTDRPGGE